MKNSIKLLSCFLLLFLVKFSGFSQKTDSSFSPNGIFDNVFDDKGNSFKLSDIIVEESRKISNGNVINNTLLCTSGIFELYFETGCGMEVVGNTIHDQRRAIICQAFSDMSDFIITPLKNSGNSNKVKIWIRSPVSLGLPTGAVGAASAYYNVPTGNNIIASQGYPIRGIVDNEIWKTINSGTDSYSNTVFPISTTGQDINFYHGYTCFNFNSSTVWNLDMNKHDSASGYVLNSVDFYTVIIHELTHLLGFNSLMNSTGYSLFWGNSNLDNSGWYFTRYDKFLKTPSNISLISNSYSGSSNCQMYDYFFNSNVSNAVIYPLCANSTPYQGNSGLFNCPTSIIYSGTATVPVYTPPCFENGSSLSHFEDACYNNNSNDQYFMMSDRASGLFAKRFLTTEERLTLCDIGYSLNTTFGTTSNFTYKDYNSTICNGNGVAGTNDGINSSGGYIYQGLSGTIIPISGILSNDYTNGSLNNLRYEYVQNLTDPNAYFSQASGSSNQTITMTSYVPGIHVLRYVPYDNATGKRGNVTYIYVNVLNNCNQEDICSLVKNGNFEEHNYSPNNNSQIYKACGWQNASYKTTAEYYNSNATSQSYGIPCNFAGLQHDKISNNHAYAGMFISFFRPNFLQNVYSESIKTELVSALEPNTQYNLSFDVSNADKYRQRSIKFQALITDTNIELITGGIIPDNFINNNVVFLTNSTFSNSSSASTDGWENISFTFTTGNNANLKYLYLGGLNNVLTQTENNPNTDCNGVTLPNYSAEAYYYLDNVRLVPVFPINYLNANDDDFTNTPINGQNGGITNSVFNNDYYDELLNNQANISNVVFSLVSPSPIPGASINDLGQIVIPANTNVGNYTFNYTISNLDNCVNDAATAMVTIDNNLANDNYSNSNQTINVFPNPTFNSVSFDNSFANYYSVFVYNTLGQKLSFQNLESSKNETINLSELPKGVYFLMFLGENNQVVKIVKN
ncbi:T9SS type A sorting domain-containing protein [uncultured Flavobacterium sp.]|uniref:T9SS type A sorting domain-containing protein n=1 Tax=uncultured Flavobacterium sp. TaxID=165435 RepID=UPI0030EBD6DF|tara:strand:- start:9757 stop:12657 length:2901 start_codon:yes stop_codon:yes gene_type:complete